MDKFERKVQWNNRIFLSSFNVSEKKRRQNFHGARTTVVVVVVQRWAEVFRQNLT